MNNEMIALYGNAANGDSKALDFLIQFGKYISRVERLASSDKPDHQEFLNLLAMTNLLMSLEFPVRHLTWLNLPIMGCMNKIAKSLDEDSPRLAQEGKIDVIIAVAMICGGFSHGMRIGNAARELAQKVQVENG